MTELKPCPFCGGEVVLQALYGGNYVECGTCKCSTERFVKIEDAIQAWNTRPNPWHTGTPTEEGLYILLTDFQVGGLSFSAGTYTLDYWDGYSFKELKKRAEMNAIFKPNMYSWVAWQKATLFK